MSCRYVRHNFILRFDPKQGFICKNGHPFQLLAKVKCETKYEERMRSVTCAQAAIVRVAKRALRISKKELVQRAIWELGSRASPDPSVIISALESLVDKDYLDYDGKTGIITYVL